MVSYIVEKMPSREDYFGETKYYSARYATCDHSPQGVDEGKYYSPRYATSEDQFPPEKTKVPPKTSNHWKTEHVLTGQASYTLPDIQKEAEEYNGPPQKAHGSPQKPSKLDDLILFTSSYMEDNRRRYYKKRYLVCNQCQGYYQLQEDEDPEDFNLECECGGKLEYVPTKD